MRLHRRCADCISAMNGGLMHVLKFWPMACIALALGGCGGSSEGLDGAASGGDATLRLASEMATVKPWDATTGLLATAEASEVAPTKTSTAIDPTGVPSGAVTAYDPNLLPVIGGEPSASALWPTWRQSMGRWQWKQIPGTDLSSVAPNPRVPGALSARIDAWNGLAADTRGSRLYSAANGGHADYSGNEVYEIDLSQNSPAWSMIRPPSAATDIVASDYTKGIYNDYYLDGRPASTHTYYALNFIGSRNAIFKFGAGSLWGSGNESNWKTDAFSLSAGDWQPAGTWPEATPGQRGGAIAASICKHPLTEEVFVATPGNPRKFDPVSGTYTALAAWPDNASAVYARGCAVDPVRNRVVFFGDAYRTPTGGLVYDIASNAFSRITFGGQDAPTIAADKYHFAWYEGKLGQFLLKTTVGGDVYAIDPQSFQVQRVATAGADSMPDAANGVQTRWQRLPNLGGYAYYPRNGSGIWFLAVE